MVDPSAAPQPRRQPQPGDVLDGTYRLDEQLGKGGVGVVFKAWHMHLQRPCAVKLLHPQLVSNEELRTRFRREAQSAFQLGNPHIVAITDFRDDPSAWPYIVMELVQGQTLRDRLEQGPLPPPLAVRMMVQLCDALMTAHRRGVIHRDLKPENLFLARVEAPAPGEPEVTLKVLDFGLSKLLDAMEITGTGRLLGSPSYMSPEQARGDSHQVDARSDIFSVGTLLYECLTADKLFSSEDFEEKRQQIIEARLPPLRLTERGMPAQLERIIQKACSKLPEERYQSAQSLMNALNGVSAAAAKVTGTLAAVPAPTPPVASNVSAEPPSGTISVSGGELVAAPAPELQIAPPPPSGRSAMGPLAAGLALVAVCGLGYAGYTLSQARTTATPISPTVSTPPVVPTEPEKPVAPPKPEPPKPEPPKPETTPVAALPAEGPATGATGSESKGAAEDPATKGPPATKGLTPPHTGPVTAAHPGPATPWKGGKWKGPAAPRPIAVPPGVKPPPLPTEDGAPSTQAAALSANAVMRRAMGAVARCFPEGSAIPPKVSVDVTVVGDGKVSEVTAEGADDHGGCVSSVVKGLRFAPPTDSDSYSIRYDFVNLGLLRR